MFRKNVVVKTRILYRPVFLYRLPGPGSLPRVSMSHPIMTFQTRITQCTCNPLRRRSSIVIWCRSKFQQMNAYKLVSSLYLLVMCMEKPGFSTGSLYKYDIFASKRIRVPSSFKKVVLSIPLTLYRPTIQTNWEPLKLSIKLNTFNTSRPFQIV